MKNQLLTLGLLAALAAQSAFAAEPYVRTFGGSNWKEPFGSDGGDSTLRAEGEVGFVVGGALGVALADIPGVSTELEVSYRENDLDGLFDGCDNIPLGGADSTFAVLGNVVYHSPWTLARIQPYVLAGAGFSARRVAFDPTPSNYELAGNGAERQGFAWQVGGGLEYPLSDGTYATLDYRYFQGVAINRMVEYGKNDAFMTANGNNHSLTAGVIFRLN